MKAKVFSGVGMPATKVIPYNDHLQSSYLEVAVKLTSGHFNNGILRLQCTAMVTSIYRETREKILSSKTEPVPERGGETFSLDEKDHGRRGVEGGEISWEERGRSRRGGGERSWEEEEEEGDIQYSDRKSALVGIPKHGTFQDNTSVSLAFLLRMLRDMNNKEKKREAKKD
ncbi:hypothetical protein M8J77_019774 [Diaphorina citri]|nr:hypothetical protein M8J77_019774 [Diaphorina citri]